MCAEDDRRESIAAIESIDKNRVVVGGDHTACDDSCLCLQLFFQGLRSPGTLIPTIKTLCRAVPYLIGTGRDLKTVYTEICTARIKRCSETTDRNGYNRPLPSSLCLALCARCAALRGKQAGVIVVSVPLIYHGGVWQRPAHARRQ